MTFSGKCDIVVAMHLHKCVREGVCPTSLRPDLFRGHHSSTSDHDLEA